MKQIIVLLIGVLHITVLFRHEIQQFEIIQLFSLPDIVFQKRSYSLS